MNSILEIEDLAAKYYGPNQEEREYASKTLEERLFLQGVTTGGTNTNFAFVAGENVQPCENALMTVFRESSHPYTLFYVAQAAVQWSARYTLMLCGPRRKALIGCVGESLRRLGLSFATTAANSLGLPSPVAQLPPDATTRALFGGATPVAVLKSVCTCYAQLLKLSLEKGAYLVDAVNFPIELLTLSANEVEYRLGLILMDTVVTEFNNFISSKSENYLTFIRHRLCSGNFRDLALMDYFQASLQALRRLGQQAQQQASALGQPNYMDNASETVLLSPQHPHLEEVILLIQHCLTYDFMSIFWDETEEIMNSHYPDSWKSILLQDETHLLLWKSLAFTPLPHCKTLMRGLGSLCGIRRTFLEPNEREIYLNRILTLFTESFQYGRKENRMEDGSYMAEVAESCMRIVQPFGYRDLHRSPMFLQWVTIIKDVTLSTLRRPWDGQWHENPSLFGSSSPNGLQSDSASTSFVSATTTFLKFWARITTSMRLYMVNFKELSSSALRNSSYSSSYLTGASSSNRSNKNDEQGANDDEEGQEREKTNEILNEFVMEIVRTFCLSRISPHISICLTPDTPAMTDAIMSQCESITNLCTLDPSMILRQIQEYLGQAGLPNLCANSASSVMWLFYLAGGIVRWVLSNVEGSEIASQTQFLRVFVECVKYRRALFSALDQEKQRAEADDEMSLFGPTVDVALLYCITYMKLILCTDRMHPSLMECVTLVFQSKMNLFMFLIAELIPSLMRGVPEGQQSVNETVVGLIKGSVDLIGELCSDMQSSFTEPINFYIPPVIDLPLSRSIHTYRLRTNIYNMLWSLRMPQKYSVEAFSEFLYPIQERLEKTVNENVTDPSYIAGWLRDLRGVARAVNGKHEARVDFIEWFCKRSTCFHNMLDTQAGDSSLVIISFLRFVQELLLSRHDYHLLNSSSHSSSGLLLFTTVCGFIQQIVQRCITDEKVQMVVSSCGPVDGAYTMMLKPLSLCMGLLRTCVTENFVPFGAMWYYHDDTYDKTLLGLLRMLVVFPDRIFKEYNKVPREILRLLHGVATEKVYHPFEKLSTEELQTILFFVVNRCEDVGTPVDQLLHGLFFLKFISGFIRDVKNLLPNERDGKTWQQSLSSGGENGNGTPIAGTLGGTPLPTPQPSSYYVNGVVSSISGTLGGVDGEGGTSRALRAVRETIARRLQPITGLWTELIRLSMSLIVFKGNDILSNCNIIFSIVEADPPSWYEFCDQFVQGYAPAKQSVVRDALASLNENATSYDSFTSEMQRFRQTMREV